ncbi:hypothetical protein [Bacillus sp. FJAT-42376]|uniref:hypothetical protein n=1 Tax=Bacillus sp. FJAT-42376 TaxID=2014076 RepID=UPI0013DE0362|nr:hypothetical protein [Bacillus sp. FJAT-42376]
MKVDGGKQVMIGWAVLGRGGYIDWTDSNVERTNSVWEWTDSIVDWTNSLPQRTK